MHANMQDTATHYHVKVGPYWHQVDKQTGRHTVVGKDAKLPVIHVLATDQDGTQHIRREKP